MGSSRRFGTTSELKLQRMLRQHDPREDLPSMDSPSVGDRSTRFDYKAVEAAKVREEIGRKQDVSAGKGTGASKKSFSRNARIVGKKFANNWRMSSYHRIKRISFSKSGQKPKHRQSSHHHHHRQIQVRRLSRPPSRQSQQPMGSSKGNRG